MQEEQNSEEAPMNFDPDNPFYAQLFRYRYDTLTSEREKERDSLLTSRYSMFLTSHYPPYGMFRAAEELTKDKIVYENLNKKEILVKKKEEDPLNIIRLAQTTDILSAVLNEREENREKISSRNTQFMEFQTKS